MRCPFKFLKTFLQLNSKASGSLTSFPSWKQQNCYSTGAGADTTADTLTTRNGVLLGLELTKDEET
jgi:hypothetical protein